MKETSSTRAPFEYWNAKFIFTDKSGFRITTDRKLDEIGVRDYKQEAVDHKLELIKNETLILPTDTKPKIHETGLLTRIPQG